MDILRNAWHAVSRDASAIVRALAPGKGPPQNPQHPTQAEFINNAWYAILDEADIPRRGQLLRLKRFSTDMIVWRGASGVTVQKDRCPHKGAPLSLGKIHDDRVRCLYHGMEFDERGACKHVPQFEDQSKIPKRFCAHTYSVRVAHGIVWLWWGDAEPSAEIPFFPEVANETRLTRSSAVDFPVSFLRVMESHFDLYHVDHLHGWPLVLGRIVRESRVERTGQYIQCVNVYENPRNGVQQTTRSTILFPGLSLQESLPNFSFKIVVAATPIDAETTWFFMRHYVSVFRLPVLGPVLNALNNLNSYIRILPEDAELQSRQLPRESGIGSDQLIVPADRGILEYWRMVRQSREHDKTGSLSRRSDSHAATAEPRLDSTQES